MSCETHLATDILALDTLAKKSLDTLKYIKLNQAYKAADKLYSFLYTEVSDEEKTYIHMTRYLYILDYIHRSEKDAIYFQLKYGQQRQEIEKKQKELRASLQIRYKNLNKKSHKSLAVREVMSMPILNIDENIFGTDKYITCQQLYQASVLKKNVLVIDIRPKNQFEISHLKPFTTINIDEALVVSGLSANKLGETLDNNVKEIFDKRNTFEYIVLVDFDSTQDSFTTSRIKILFVILTEWDINTIYKHSPYILKGGYADFVDRYPTCSTNPNVILCHKYSDLDELLDLEAIQYPEEFATLDDSTQNLETDSLYTQILNNTSQLLMIEKKLLNIQNKLYNPDNFIFKDRIESDIDNMSRTKSRLITENQLLNVNLKLLMEKRPRDNIQRKAAICDVEYQIANISRERRKLIDANKLEEVSSGDVPEVESYETVGDLSIISDIPKFTPLVDRNTKPKFSALSVKENSGNVGLVNIRNTCYMNSILQCLRYLPSIKKYFLFKLYEKDISKDEPNLINEVADLFKKLWTTTARSITPSEFYRKVTSLNPTFKRGHHEDASEFFMFVYDQLFEDTASPVQREKYAEAKYQTFYDRIQYRTSFFIREFFHQLRTDCVCSGCSKKCLKYDIENVLMFGVPEQGNFSIEDMFNKFMRTCEISDYYCRKCERKSDIVREFSFQPKVIAFLLKRYSFDKGVAEKINVPCDFPLDNFRMGNATYKLWAVCLHQGGMQAGHYTAVCLNHEDGLWYDFNDESVRPIDIHSRAIKEKVYMLFYESHHGSPVGFYQESC